MKKLFALMLAALMLCTGIAACAEVVTFDTALTIDADQVLAIAGMEADDETGALVTTLVNAVNAMYTHSHFAQSGIDSTLYLNDTAVMYDIIDWTNGISAFSSLVPGYALNVSAETLQEVANQIAVFAEQFAGDEEGASGFQFDAEAYQQILFDFLMPLLTAEPEELDPEEYDIYTSRTTYVINADDLNQCIVDLGNQLLADLAANGIDVGMTEFPTDEMPKFEGTQLVIEVYTSEDGQVLIRLADLGEDSDVSMEITAEYVGFNFLYAGKGLTGTVVTGEDGSLNLDLNIIEDGVASMNVSLYFGKDEDGFSVVSVIVSAQDQELFAVVFNEFADEAGKAFALSAYFMGSEDPIAVLTFIIGSEEDESHMFALPEDVEPIDAVSLVGMDEEGKNELLTEVLGNAMEAGLPAAMESITTAMPELGDLIGAMAGSLAG